jgi:hypothetical protein
MNFPICDISEFSWNNYRIKEHNVLYENPYSCIAPSNRNKFAEKIKKFKYVDPDGLIHRVVGFKVHSKRGLAKLFSLTKKIEFELVRVDELYTIEEFKELLINSAKETQDKKLQEIAENANSFKDILHQI